jgi:UPF0755 protein
MKREKLLRIGLILIFVFVLALVGGTAFIRYTYDRALQPVSKSQMLVLVTVPSGSSVKDISGILKTAGVIREKWAFEWYVRNNGLGADLKAGTYAFTPSQSVADIANILVRGEVATDLVTILPGQRLDQIQAALINAGFKPADVKRALNPNLYKNHPALVDKPRGASLEGYLYPESFEKSANTSPQDIIRSSLDEMQKRLTPDVRNGFAKHRLSVHQGIILASIIEKEVNTADDRDVAAQVFLKRLKDGMRLQSDVTGFYGAILAGQPPTVTFDSAYNTHTHDGLPPGPISNVTKSSLLAVVSPAKTDYVYFVAGDDGRTYFSRTYEEHLRAVKAHCHKLCQ